jgi:hypothetical protein
MSSPLETLVSDTANALTREFESLLRGLGLLPANAPTLDEKRIMQTVATNMSKYWAAISAAAGGSLSVASIIAAWKASEETTKLALISGASVALAATVVAVALIVRSDLTARAGVTNALFQARADLATAVVAAPAAAVASATRMASAQPLADLLAHVALTLPDQTAIPGIYGVRREAAGQPIEVLRSDGTWTPLQGQPLSDLAFSFEAPRPG